MEDQTPQPVKQVIVVRVKYPDGRGGTMKPRAGKLIAQASHASGECLWEEIDYPKASLLRLWRANNMPKIVCQVDSEEELMEIARKAQQAGVNCHVITDSGRTEFHGVPTNTCLALGPDHEDKINLISGNLRLF